MNIQTFLYNENFYKKLALTMAIIRSTPNDLTPKEYTIQLQNLIRKKKINQTIPHDLRLLSKNQTKISIPRKSFDLLEIYGKFLQTMFSFSIDMNIEIQAIIIETIDRCFQLIKEDFRLIKQEKYEFIFKQLINIIFNFDLITNIQHHIIEHIRKFIDILLFYIKQENFSKKIQNIIEQIGSHPSYFLLVFERILLEFLTYFDRSTSSSSSYVFILLNILQNFITFHDNTILEQIFNNDFVRQQFQFVLYRCLSNQHQDTSLTIQLWNLYGRIF